MITHEQAFKDRQYLWKTYGAAYDMTGGYVDSDDLEKLLEKPNKRTARACLINQIEYWFQRGPDRFHGESQDDYREDRRVIIIAERYDQLYSNAMY